MIDPKYLARDWYNAKAEFDRDYIAAQIVAHNGSLIAAAKTMCVDRGSLYRRMRKLGLNLRTICAEQNLPYTVRTPSVQAVKAKTQPWVPSGYALVKGQLHRIEHDSTCQPE